MGPRRVVSLILSALLVMSIPITIMLGVATNLVLDKGYYLDRFAARGVYGNFNDKALPETLITQIVSYFSKEASTPPNIYIMGADEKSHLLDVNRVVIAVRRICFTSLAAGLAAFCILSLFYPSYIYPRVPKLLIISGVATLALSLALVILGLNFSWAFTRFHTIFFPQGNWMFPVDSTLIRLFPQALFQDFFTQIIIRSAFCGLLVMLIGFAASRIGKRYKTGTHI